MANDPKAPAATTAAPTTEQLDAARASGVLEAQNAAAKQITDANSAGVKAERERVAGILTHAEADGRRKLAEHLAFKTANSVEDAAALMAAAPKEASGAANPLAAAMAGIKNPKVGADADPAGTQAGAAPLDSAKIYAMRRKSSRPTAA